MSVLKEMLELNEERMLANQEALLLEYLGTVAVVDKHLVKSLKKPGGHNIAKGKDPKAPTVGSQSKVEKKVVNGRNTDMLWKMFTDDDTVVAFVLNYDDKQIMAISDKTRTMSDSEKKKMAEVRPMIYTVASELFFNTVMPQKEFDTTFESNYDKKGWRASGQFGKSRELIGGASQNRVFVRKLIELIVAKARKEKKAVEALFIYKDKEQQPAKTADKAPKK